MKDNVSGLCAALAATANVVMQLSWSEVGYGVIESRVERGQLTKHPLRRLRTTFTYLAVAMFGTEEERTKFCEAVNGSHALVRSTPASPVEYDAFDPTLQRWVAACLYYGSVDVRSRMWGPMPPDLADRFFEECSRFATTLQVPREHWPADRDAFDCYWATALGRVHIDEPVRRYLDRIVEFRYLPRPLARILGPLNRFVTAGFLPTRFRDEMGISWSDGEERRFNELLRVVAGLNRVLPAVLRRFPFNACLLDMRIRIILGRRLL